MGQGDNVLSDVCLRSRDAESKNRQIGLYLLIYFAVKTQPTYAFSLALEPDEWMEEKIKNIKS